MLSLQSVRPCVFVIVSAPPGMLQSISGRGNQVVLPSSFILLLLVCRFSWNKPLEYLLAPPFLHDTGKCLMSGWKLLKSEAVVVPKKWLMFK